MPRKKQIIIRSEYISFRVSNIEKEVIQLTAKDAGLNSSTFVRRVALNKRIVEKINNKDKSEWCVYSYLLFKLPTSFRFLNSKKE